MASRKFAPAIPGARSSEYTAIGGGKYRYDGEDAEQYTDYERLTTRREYENLRAVEAGFAGSFERDRLRRLSNRDPATMPQRTAPQRAVREEARRLRSLDALRRANNVDMERDVFLAGYAQSRRTNFSREKDSAWQDFLASLGVEIVDDPDDDKLFTSPKRRDRALARRNEDDDTRRQRIERQERAAARAKIRRQEREARAKAYAQKQAKKGTKA